MRAQIGFVLILVGLGLAGRAVAQDCNLGGLNVASFQGLGDLPGGNFSSEAHAVSADGSVAVGKSMSASGQQSFRWTLDGGMVGLGYLPGTTYSDALAASADGSVVVGRSRWAVGWGTVDYAYRWTAAGGMEALTGTPPCGGTYCGEVPRAVSADGSLIVGDICSYSLSLHCKPFRWTSAEGESVLPGAESSNSRVSAVSADGSVVVGSVVAVGSPECDCAGSGCFFLDPFRWTADDGMVALGLPPTGCSGSQANDASADGSVLVGSWEEYPAEAFRWKDDTGLVTLGDLPGGEFYSSANGISGDGSVVVGASESAYGLEAFIWNDDNGMRSLLTVLIDEYGVDLTGWTLTSAEDISDDGRTIVGYGTNPDGFTEGWIAALPKLEATLVIGDCDTEVENGVDTEGCKLADELAATCPQSTEAKAHGEFVSCVAQLAKSWLADGRIDSGESGKIVSCAAGGKKGAGPK